MERNASTKGSSKGCGPSMQLLGIRMADIEENDSNWFGTDARVKRNSISELLLDDWREDRLSISEEFRNMSARGSKTSTLPEQETSYISSTLNAAGKIFEQHLLFVNDYVADQLTLVTNALEAARNGSALMRLLQNIQILSHVQTLQDVITCQMQIMTSFSSKQRQYLSILANVGTNDAQMANILASDILMSELNNIRSIVSEKGLDFPMKLTSTNVRFLLLHSAPEVTLLDDQIFITFQLPLISRLSGNHFTLLKVTSSLHKLQDNLYSFIVPNHEFIAIDAHKERYTALTVDNLNNCLRISDSNAIICEEPAAMMPTLTSSECEIMTLNKRDSSVDKPNDCRRRYMRTDKEILIEVLRPNSWLVTMPNTTKIRYMCDGMATQEYFTQINGLLTIDPNCKFATDNVLIAGHSSLSKFPIQELLSQNSSSNIEGVSLDDFAFHSNDVPQVISFGDSEKLLRISYSLLDIKLKSMQVAEDEMEKRKKAHEPYLMGLMIVSLIILVPILTHACVLDAKRRIRISKLRAPTAP